MKDPVVVVGIGEMGGVFARGLLKSGHPVYPVPRDISLQQAAAAYPQPEMVLVAVAEAQLADILGEMPEAWRDRLCLLQNELLPADWSGLDPVTVISVWFEKKKGMDAKVIIPSPVYGPHGGLIEQALAAVDIPVKCLDSADQLLFELVLKNLYILTSNIAGLRTGGSVGGLWRDRREFATAVAMDVIDLQEALTGRQFDREGLIAAMVQAFDGDPGHQCMGRSAPQRLARAIGHADRLGLKVGTLRRIQAGS